MRHSTFAEKLGCTIAIALAVGFTGCEKNVDPEPSAKIDSQLLLPREPTGAITPTEAMESHIEAKPIVLAGRVDAGDFDPFESGLASFMLSELPDEDHASDDPNHVDNCPFCKRKLEKAPKAVVKILDSSGDVMPVDARELLGIAKGDIVVVRGSGRYSEAVNLVEITADGVFRR